MLKESNCVSILYRENKSACSCDRHFSRSGRKSSCHYWDFFDNKTVLLIGLLPEGQNCSYLLENPWSDLYTGDQLDVDALMLGYYHWLSRHETHGQCIRYSLHMIGSLPFSTRWTLGLCFCLRQNGYFSIKLIMLYLMYIDPLTT